MSERTYNNQSRKRVFTREEDELIMLNIQGKLSQTILMQTLGCGTETLQRRASELGVQIRKHLYKPNNNRVKHERKDPDSGEVFTSHHEVPHVGEDLLLRKLYLEYGERRYESLIMKSTQEREDEGNT